MKENCDALRTDYPNFFKAHNDTFNLPSQATYAALIQNALYSQTKEYWYVNDNYRFEHLSVVFKDSDDMCKFSEPVKSSEPTGSYFSIKGMTGEKLWLTHTHDIGLKSYSFKHQGITAEQFSRIAENFSVPDIKETTKPGSPPIFVHTPSNQLKVYSQERHGFPSEDDLQDPLYSHPGSVPQNAPSAELTSRVIQCQKAGN